MKRRDVLFGTLALSGWSAFAPSLAFPARAAAASEAEGRPFSVEWLRAEARHLAAEPYRPPESHVPPAIADLDWNAYQAIKYRPDKALWRDLDLAFQVRFFHLGLNFHDPVALHEVVDGVARPIAYSSDLFDYGPNHFDPPLPPDLGFAGFRLHYQINFDIDMVAFLGASYFRAIGGQKQYGISARGLAINTGLPQPEEFPIFRAFWLERPPPKQSSMVVHALLDSESVTGAYSFNIRPGSTTVMDVSATLFPRKPIERLGIAPLTSMYQHGENDRRVSDDFRPEVHDSDGLAMWTSAGEWIWRPLVNPPELRVNSYLDENPRGFGLLQRDRNFRHYQDDGVYYDRRPSLWVEPLGQWGKGAVQLVEIPANQEIFDNIVAYWTPEQPVTPGTELPLTYRLYWGGELPVEPPLAQVIATRVGVGGIPGKPRLHNSRKFVIDFKGGMLDMLAKDSKVEPVVSASSGLIELPAARPIEELGGWRVNFDLRPTGAEPINLRCYLRLGSMALTETWLYQWTPTA